MRWDFGTVLKEIREARGLTQQAVCGDALSRTTLSKIENNKEYPTIEHFVHILCQLDITFGEFDYICHVYQPSKRSCFIHTFEQLYGKTTTPDEYRIFLQEMATYLKQTDDIRIRKIHQQVTLALALTQTENNDTAKKIANNMWCELQQSSTWYLSDIGKLALILPFLPYERWNYLVHKTLVSLEKYKNYKDIIPLQFNILYNLSTILWKANNKKECLKVTNSAYEIAKKSMRLDYLSLINVRIGMLTQDHQRIETWLTILRSAEMFDLIDQLEKELEKFDDWLVQ